MSENLKNKILYVALYFSLGVLYFSFVNSILVRDMMAGFFGDFSAVLFAMEFLSLMVLSSIFMLNLYTLIIMKKKESALFLLISLLMLVFTIVSFLVKAQTEVLAVRGVFALEESLKYYMVLLVQLLLVFNVFVAKDNYFNNIPRPGFIALFLALIAGITLAQWQNWFSASIYEFMILVLMITNIFGYMIRYFLTGDVITRNIFATVVIYFVTSMYPSASLGLTGYESFVKSGFQNFVILLLANAFYRDVFVMYFLEREELDKQRKIYADNLVIQVQERTRGLEEMNSLLNSEIDAAKKLQMSIFPDRHLSFQGADFITNNYAFERLSGDFLDVYSIDDDYIGMYILDVSGHGISAALLSIYTYQYIRSSNVETRRYLASRPDKNLRRLFEEFNRMNFPDNMHLVMFLASYNRKTRELTYSSGGLNVHPILLRHNGEMSFLDQSEGFPICNMGEHFKPEYDLVKVKLEVGDRILFYTDGLIEDEEGLKLTLEDVQYIFVKHAGNPLEDMHKELDGYIYQFRDVINDDISYFIMEVTE